MEGAGHLAGGGAGPPEEDGQFPLQGEELLVFAAVHVPLLSVCPHRCAGGHQYFAALAGAARDPAGTGSRAAPAPAGGGRYGQGQRLRRPR
ncbi:hypothetical protein GCM10010286_23470 [Streptomyces toxytricini]|nr:hypothetical protein GCM10010286_23470 [Streptomyces toxytricini]